MKCFETAGHKGSDEVGPISPLGRPVFVLSQRARRSIRRRLLCQRAEIKQIVCASVRKGVIFGGGRLRYSGIVDVIHFARTHVWVFTCGLKASTRRSDMNIPTLTLQDDPVRNPCRCVTRRVAEQPAVSARRPWRSASWESVCGVGISVRPWLSQNQTTTPSTPETGPAVTSLLSHMTLELPTHPADL